jgi:chaperonin cofactor prefoldin
MEAGMTDQFHPINWDNLPDSVKLTMLHDRADKLTTQLQQLTAQVQQLASVSATMQARLDEMQARLDDMVHVRSGGGGGGISE